MVTFCSLVLLESSLNDSYATLDQHLIGPPELKHAESDSRLAERSVTWNRVNLTSYCEVPRFWYHEFLLLTFNNQYGEVTWKTGSTEFANHSPETTEIKTHPCNPTTVPRIWLNLRLDCFWNEPMLALGINFMFVAVIFFCNIRDARSQWNFCHKS